jgi:hypothetical protein
MARHVHTALVRAFDEARFGPARTLDVRTSLPTAAEAVRRAEPWLRERQMARAGEVLIITGRGRGSPGGIGVVRAAVYKLLTRLKRQGVVARVTEHTPGSFVAELAPILALFDRPARSRARRSDEEAPFDRAMFGDLDDATRAELRVLAEYSLTQLGVEQSAAFVRDEMARYFSVLVRGIAPDETDRAARLRFLIAASRAAFEDNG